MKRLSSGMSFGGRLILNTRHREKSSELTALLEEYGARVFVYPTIEIESCLTEAERSRLVALLESPTCIILTSATAVSELRSSSLIDPLRNAIARIFVVGEKTAQAARTAGLSVSAIPDQQDALGVAQLVADTFHSEDHELRHVVYLGARDRESRGLEKLRELGMEVEDIALYQTVMPEHPNELNLRIRELVRGEQLDAIMGFSSLGVSQLVEMIVERGTEDIELTRILDVPLIVVGPRTAATAMKVGFRKVHFPVHPSVEDMVDLLGELFGLGYMDYT